MPELSNGDIARLYINVLQNDKCGRKRNFHQQFCNAVRAMGEAYKPNGRSFTSSDEYLRPDYDGQMFRYAYLFKYGAFHTALVQEMVLKLLHRSSNAIQNELDIQSNGLKVCCLGGGPGTDLLGLLSTLVESVGFFKCTAVIVDEKKWQKSFDSLVKELKNGRYGMMSKFINLNLNWKYVNADLLDEMESGVTTAIGSSDLITMVKFLSAAMCYRAVDMVESIFNSMGPGSFLLFIDNAAGGFRELMFSTATRCGMIEICEPLKHEHYHNLELLRTIFNISSCFQTKVTVQLWRKGSKRKLPPKRKLLASNKFNPTQIFKPQEAATEVFKPQTEQIIQSKTGISSCSNNSRIISPSPVATSPVKTISQLHPPERYIIPTKYQLPQQASNIPSSLFANSPSRESTSRTSPVATSPYIAPPQQRYIIPTKYQLPQQTSNIPSSLTASSPVATSSNNIIPTNYQLPQQTSNIPSSLTANSPSRESTSRPSPVATSSYIAPPQERYTNYQLPQQTSKKPSSLTANSPSRESTSRPSPVATSPYIAPPQERYIIPTKYQLPQQTSNMPTSLTANSPSRESSSRPLFYKGQTSQNIQPSSKTGSTSAKAKQPVPVLGPKHIAHTISIENRNVQKTYGTLSSGHNNISMNVPLSEDKNNSCCNCCVIS